MLDPKTVFEQVVDQAANKKPSVFDKDFGVHKRQRQGYEDDLDGTMRRIKPASEFINTTDPIAMLSECHGFSFKEEEDRVYLNHKATDQDVKEALTDLKLLGKAEFKALLLWRLKMIEFRNSLADGSGDEDEESDDSEGEERRLKGSDDEEEEIQAEIDKAKEKKMRKLKREKKKEREIVSAKQRRARPVVSSGSIHSPSSSANLFSFRLPNCGRRSFSAWTRGSIWTMMLTLTFSTWLRFARGAG